MKVADLETRVYGAERRLERRLGEARALAGQGKDAEAEVQELTRKVEALNEAIDVLNGFADERQVTLQAKIETLVTHGLRTVFDDPQMEFKIVPGQRGKNATAEFVVRTMQEDREVVTPVLDARGGGVAAVAGFLLRLIVLLLRPGARPILFLDESFAQLSVDYEPRLAEFLRDLADRTEVQIVLVTHSDGFADVADIAYRFQLVDGVTQVTGA